jgi:hypothetical protein
MSYESLIHDFWISGLVLQSALALVLLAKRFWGCFPLFTAYSLFNLVGTAVCFLIRSKGVLYFYTFWINEGIAILLGLAVVFEIFQHLFSVHIGLRKLATLVLRISIVVLIVGGILVAILQSSGMASRVVKAVVTIAEGARIVEVGLFLSLFVFSTVFGLHWRQHIFGIALGLGINTAVELVVLAMHVHFGIKSAPALSVLRLVSFSTALLIWIGYILVPEPATVGELPKREQLEQWNKAVMEFMHQ